VITVSSKPGARITSLPSGVIRRYAPSTPADRTEQPWDRRARQPGRAVAAQSPGRRPESPIWSPAGGSKLGVAESTVTTTARAIKRPRPVRTVVLCPVPGSRLMSGPSAGDDQADVETEFCCRHRPGAAHPLPPTWWIPPSAGLRSVSRPRARSGSQAPTPQKRRGRSADAAIGRPHPLNAVGPRRQAAPAADPADRFRARSPPQPVSTHQLGPQSGPDAAKPDEPPSNIPPTQLPPPRRRTPDRHGTVRWSHGT